MDKKFLLSLLFVILSIQMVSAAYTVTWVLPATGSTYSNNPANRQTIDLNFTITDTNTVVARDANIAVRYWDKGAGPSGAVTIVARADWNALKLTPNSYQCSNDSWTAGKKCHVSWTMPLDTTMPEGTYVIDANIQSYVRDTAQNGTYDANSLLTIVVSNHMSNIAQLRSMMGTLMVILAVAALLAIVGMGIIVKPEPIEFVKNSFLIGVIVVSIAIVIGFVVTLM